ELTGTIAGGRADVGTGALGLAAPDGARDGSRVRAFVRPSEVRIAKPDENAPSVALALVEGLTRVGSLVKVELRLPSSEAITMEIGRAELEALGIAAGDHVMVDLVDAKIFVEDYSI